MSACVIGCCVKRHVNVGIRHVSTSCGINVRAVFPCADVAFIVSHSQLVCQNGTCCENVRHMHVVCFFIAILQHRTPADWLVYPMLYKVVSWVMHITKYTLSLTAGAVFLPSSTPATSPDAWIPGPRPGPAAAALHQPPIQLPFPSPTGTALACQACADWK